MKKNIRNIPDALRKKLSTLRGRNIVAGCALSYTADFIRGGGLTHLNISLSDAGLQLPERIIPPATSGKYSLRNVAGWEEVRRDLPIEIHHHPAESPNWGDSYNGTHTSWLRHKAYPKDFHSPRELEISLQCPNGSATNTKFVIVAKVDEVLSQTAPDFDDRLLENLNLLQENLGGAGAEPSDISMAEYIRTLRVTWDILPPGSREDAIQRLFRGRQPTRDERDTATSRYDFFQSLNPRQLIVGSSAFRRYFGALLEDNLVVFENIQYGNAIYIMYQNWQQLSQRSRLELLSGRVGDQFERIIHKDGWQGRVRLYVEARRQAMPSRQMGGAAR
ncbi:MAG: hypothetical protein C0404_09275 [Verrucomicrobia bacterium]|nr:hypothetical protein [Verrucomicrobiota bacterium]